MQMIPVNQILLAIMTTLEYIGTEGAGRGAVTRKLKTTVIYISSLSIVIAEYVIFLVQL